MRVTNSIPQISFRHTHTFHIFVSKRRRYVMTLFSNKFFVWEDFVIADRREEEEKKNGKQTKQKKL